MQLDEWADIASQSQISMFIHYASSDEVSENLLFGKALLLHNKDKDIFQHPDFFREHSIPWGKSVEIYTDGVAARTGKKWEQYNYTRESIHCEVFFFLSCMKR